MGLSNSNARKPYLQEPLGQNALVLHWPRSIRLSDDQFYEFCRENRARRIERTANGDYVVMAPTGGETSWRNSRLIALLSAWADNDGGGFVFDSSGAFILPNGAVRSADVSWVRMSRLAVLSPEQKTHFLPLCPDFVIELSSPSDSISELHLKMEEYRDNGAGLGWLIEPEHRQVFVYEPDRRVVRLDNPDCIPGDPVLKGCVLNLSRIWSAPF